MAKCLSKVLVQPVVTALVMGGTTGLDTMQQLDLLRRTIHISPR